MKALTDLLIKDLLFLDIETVRVEDELQIDTPLFDSWAYKMTYEMKGATSEELIAAYKDKAALHPEFARIAVITMGYAKGDNLVLKTYNNEDEKELLTEFIEDLHKFTDKNSKTRLAGHYIIYFDIPFITRRCMVNQVEPHELLDTSTLKPWEVTAVDTKDIWKGSSPTPASLINIAVALGLPSPKDDISGAQVGDVYYGAIEGGIERISRYCEKDVLTVANVIRKCRFEEPFEPVSSLPAEDEEQIPVIKQLFAGARYTVAHKKELVEKIKAMDEDEKVKAFDILKAMVSKAKGKVTKFTAENLKELKELCK
jgi:hypothetical protein